MRLSCCYQDFSGDGVFAYPAKNRVCYIILGHYLSQVMAGFLLGVKPLPEPLLTLCQLDPEKEISV